MTDHQPTDPLKPYVEVTQHASPDGVSRSTVYVLPGENVRKMQYASLTTSEDGWCTFSTRFQLAPPFNETDLRQIAITVGDSEIVFSMKAKEK